jgi:hypothetical protein
MLRRFIDSRLVHAFHKPFACTRTVYILQDGAVNCGRWRRVHAFGQKLVIDPINAEHWGAACLLGAVTAADALVGHSL